MSSTELKSPTVSSAAEPSRRTDWRRLVALPVILSGTFMVTLDFFIVNVAIPSLQVALHASSAAIQLVVAGYGLALAVGLITAGRLGDLYGRRRVFLIGLALFTLTSAACGMAPTSTILVIGRVIQGLAAAILSPQILAMVGIVYTGEDRARAFTVYGLALGLAAVSGQLIGGLLIAANIAGLGWRTCFLINVPLGATTFFLTPRLIPESRAEGRRQLDLVGAALVTLGLAAIVLPLIYGRAQGWPLWTWLSLIVSLPLLLAFVGYQRWLGARGRAPLIALALFGERAFALGLLTVLAFYAGMASFFLALALYLQHGRGLSALAAGATFSSLGIGYLATSLYAQRLTQRLGRQTLTVGALGMALGLILLSVTVAEIGMSGPILLLTPALLLDGAGMGMVLAPLTNTVLASVAPKYAGAAAGVLSTMIQLGNALGVAILGIIFFGALGQTSAQSAYPSAFNASLIYLILLAVAVAAMLQILPRNRQK